MDFGFVDLNADVRVARGNLPHWYQPRVTYFITFRTEDSIPAEVANAWQRRRHEWLARHSIDSAQPGWNASLEQLSREQLRLFHSMFSREFMDYLDRGHGSCVLKCPELTRIVADSLLHFDGQRYHMGDFVIMPNHVHLLVCLLNDTDLERQCSSWKRFTATQINKAINSRGRFWQEESFDHLVRSPDAFEYFKCYIAENPKKANLREGEYLHYQRPEPPESK